MDSGECEQQDRKKHVFQHQYIVLKTILNLKV